MTTIANCFDINEAQRLKMLLDSVGIPSFIPDETAAGVMPHHFLTKSGVRLQVEDERAEEARKVIEQEKEAL